LISARETDHVHLSSYSSAHHRDLPSFPTRRSSDLPTPPSTPATVPPVNAAWRSPWSWPSTRSPMSSWQGSPSAPALCAPATAERSEEHTSELQSRFDLVCRLLLEKKKKQDHDG